MNILIRTDGSKDLGNGHIIRMLAFAKQLHLKNINFIFLLKSDHYWMSVIKNLSYKAILLKSKDLNNLFEIISNNSISHFFYDTRNDLTLNEFKKIKEKFPYLKMIVNDTFEDVRLEADIFFSPPINQLKEWDWTSFKGKIFSGWDYVMLRDEFILKKNVKKTNKILLSFGSTDPHLITEKILYQILKNKSFFSKYEFLLIVGPQFSRFNNIRDFIYSNSLNIKIIQSPPNIVAIFNSCFMAYISFGVTAYELASLNIPFISISISDDHEKSSSIFMENNFSISMGLINSINEKFIKCSMKMLDNYKNYSEKKIDICNWNKIISKI